jgi:hypothetical protein
VATFVYRTAAMGARAAGGRIDAPDRAAAVREPMRRGELPLSGSAPPARTPSTAPPPPRRASRSASAP